MTEPELFKLICRVIDPMEPTNPFARAGALQIMSAAEEFYSDRREELFQRHASEAK